MMLPPSYLVTLLFIITHNYVASISSQQQSQSQPQPLLPPQSQSQDQLQPQIQNQLQQAAQSSASQQQPPLLPQANQISPANPSDESPSQQGPMLTAITSQLGSSLSTISSNASPSSTLQATTSTTTTTTASPPRAQTLAMVQTTTPMPNSIAIIGNNNDINNNFNNNIPSQLSNIINSVSTTSPPVTPSIPTTTTSTTSSPLSSLPLEIASSQSQTSSVTIQSTTTTTTTTTPNPQIINSTMAPSNSANGNNSPSTTPSPVAIQSIYSLSTTAINFASSTTTTTTTTTIRPLIPAFRSQTATAPIQFIKPKTKFKCLNNTDCNNGLCDTALGICYCKPGFTGETCSIEIDECRQAEQPCQNNGTCIDAIGHYTCECQPGFRGELCQETIDMCDGSPCQNQAKCINHRTSYTCQCEPGWQGKHCELNIDECQPNPCRNNGTCQDLIDGYKCDCGQSGFIGKNCEIDFDDCAAKPCGLGARECIDLTGDFKCICHEGFEGKRCDEDIDECVYNRCENNGTCVQNSLLVHQLNGGNYSHSTDLTTSYHEVPLSSLQSANINISKIAGFTCECKPEYYGDRCEEMKKCYTKSRQELCNNDMAECVNQGSSYDCLIHSSFDGSGKNYATYRVVGKLEVHEIHVRYRSLVGGIILSFETTQPGSPVADLQLNRSGLYLSGGPINRTPHFSIDDYLDGNEREIKLLLDTPTGISSVTLSRHHYNLTDFQHEPFKGCLMEVRLNNILVPFLEYGEPNHTIFNFTHNELDLGSCKTCFEKDCLNGGQCETTRDGIDRCLCPPTYTGAACELDVDECAKEKPNPCHNGGKCLNSFGHYQCNCKDGWRGEHCQEISNYCKAKQPCGLNGICKNSNTGSSVPYHCECKSTHTGINCQDRRNCKNECHPQLAQCVNNVTCACLPGKKEERTMCEYITKCEQIDGELCRNGGLCRNAELGGYYCDCLEPFHGHICELVLEKSPYDVFLLIGIACVGFLIAAVIIVGLVIFRSVRKARATCGTYSPSTQEKYGNSACDLLKPPQPERLI